MYVCAACVYLVPLGSKHLYVLIHLADPVIPLNEIKNVNFKQRVDGAVIEEDSHVGIVSFSLECSITRGLYE